MTVPEQTAFEGPSTTLDLWSDEVLADPFPAYELMRRLGPAVWLEQHDMVALPRYAEVKAALSDWRTFSSGSGVCADAGTNAALPPGLLWSDPPEHDDFRRRTARQLAPRRVETERDEVERAARAVVDPLLDRGQAEVVTELARPFSSAVVGDFVGIAEPDREHLAERSELAFQVFGPGCPRQRAGLAAVQEVFEATMDLAGRLQPGGRGAELVAHGEPESLVSYVWPGIDTTVNAVSAALHLFADHPDQWALLREDPALVASAAAEVLRIRGPVRYFTRFTTTATSIGDVPLSRGTRVLIMYGSANHDERQFPDPERFDITRRPNAHLAFGHGLHRCAGASLALRELQTLLEVLVPRVAGLELLDAPSWCDNLANHGLARLPMRFVPV
ncbi:cytochrome P450 [Actinomycetospora sp. TBRC 11914]|uniref:cytochrome P450 n=1 Tax=Actinomycetospora sp. TBRC 11914 TaxID=2729387 RepID=UPI00145C8CAE|nr:cytochrome P450 [Actinomycetospora sp. TBRC 11914]NMO91707.1 cytochrome P450 [Actinomycetospora sp. TBRC 11914]